MRDGFLGSLDPVDIRNVNIMTFKPVELGLEIELSTGAKRKNGPKSS